MSVLERPEAKRLIAAGFFEDEALQLLEAIQNSKVAVGIGVDDAVARFVSSHHATKAAIAAAHKELASLAELGKAEMYRRIADEVRSEK